MITLALRSMGERKLRSALTAIAVLLGVAMIAGTYVQTDRITTAFTDIMRDARDGTDVVITAPTEFVTDFSAPRDIDESLVERVARIEGVRRTEGSLSASGSLVVDGEAIEAGMAPTMVFSSAEEPFNPLTVTAGALPRRPGEVAIDGQVAEREDLKVGDRVGLTTRTGVQSVVISGIAQYGEATSIGGATLVVTTLRDLQRWSQSEGRITEVLVAAEKGVSAQALSDRIDRALPGELDVRTGAQDAADTADEVNDAIGSFLTPALLALSGAALLVGAFIIFNTFSITVAQRTREFALLRALGATREQILIAVAVEALAIGVLASVVGLVAGLGFAALLGAMFDAAGMGIPTAGLELAPRTIAVSLAVGVLVTLVAAIAPARRATRVPPIAALREDVTPLATGRRRLRPYVAGAVSLLGVGGLVQGLFGGGPAAGRLSALAGGAVLLFIGIALVARYVVRPVAAFVGWPLGRMFHQPGVLARENAMRNPARTATTSAALMVGLGLVVFVAVFAAGLKTSITGAMDDVIRADVMVTAKGFQAIPKQAVDAVTGVPGVAAVSPQYFEQVEVNGKRSNTMTDYIDGVDPAALRVAYRPEWTEGSDALLGRLAGANAVIEEQFAETHGIAVGERFTVKSSNGRTVTLTAIGEYRDPMIMQGFIVDQEIFRRVATVRDPFGLFIAAADGADLGKVEADVRRALQEFPTAEVRSSDAYKDLMDEQVNQMVYLLYALLAMSLVISLFGIANSLFLSIHERTREFGLLRSIGATQGQVRRIVRYESVITAIIGGLLGTVVGVVFAALATAALADVGLELALPVGQLVAFLILAVIVGVVGAVVPARRAAGVDVLDAMHLE